MKAKKYPFVKILNYSILVILTSLFLRLAIFHWQMVFAPFPIEYREGALLLSTDLLVKGGNPYDLGYQPEYTNIYGIFYPLVVYPFAKLFGATITVHRVVSSLFNLASCFVLFWVIRQMQASVILASVAGLIFYWHLILGSNFLIRPDTVGLFLFLCSIVIPWRYQYSFPSLITSLVLSILAFMTKPYFVLSLPYIALYLFIFKSKKKGIRYGLLGLIYLGITILTLNYFFDFYFNNTIFVYLNIKLAGISFDYAIGQLSNYIIQNLGIIIVLLAITLLGWKNWLKALRQFNVIDFKQNLNKLNVFEIGEPMLKINCDLFAFCLIFSLILFCLKLGQFTGSWMGYTYHLISPFFIIVAFQIFGKLTHRHLALVLFVVFLNLLFIFPQSFITKNTYKDWDKVITLISQHQNIFNSPAIAPILAEQGKKVYDSGHSEYFIVGAERKVFNISFPSDARVTARYNEYMDEVYNSLKTKKYDLIVLTKDYSPLPENLLKQCYKYQETLPISMLADKWKLDIWKPKPLACK